MNKKYLLDSMYMDVPKYVKQAMNNARELQEQKQFILAFVLAIVFGIFGNIVATGLWEFYPDARVGFFSISVVVLVVLAVMIWRQITQINADFYGQDNIARSHFKSDEVWGRDGKLIRVNNDKVKR